MHRLEIAPRGTWRDDPTEQCSFCLREKAVVGYLVAAPNASICEMCVIACSNRLVEHRLPGWKRWWDPRRTNTFAVGPREPYRDADVACSFCGLTTPETTLAGSHARICAECVRLARGILETKIELP